MGGEAHRAGETEEFRLASEGLQMAIRPFRGTMDDMNAAGSAILLVEDEDKLARVLAEGLRAEGYSVQVARTGEEGYFVATEGAPELIVLDVMLPGRSGFEILDALRRRGIRTPVLVLTAKDAIEDRVHGLDLGADDYLVKPFAFSELLARIRALLRRGHPEAIAPLQAGDLTLDPRSRKVERGGDSVDLTGREFDLLHYLMARAGEVVSRGMIARDVWKVPPRLTGIENVIDVHIARLRRKMESGGRPRLIETVRGVGFIVRRDGP
jgi:DNA-binding response OmpR family regulator